jgi:hypothetical protein
MLVLPTGGVLVYHADSPSDYFLYNPDRMPSPAWKPAISGYTSNADGSFHLTGTRLNGLNEGAGYGDDVSDSTNYPLVRLVNNSGQVFYARSYNFSTMAVRTGNTPVSCDFALPKGLPDGAYTLSVVVNGIASDPISFPWHNSGGGTSLTRQVDLSAWFSKVAFVRDGTRFGFNTAVGPNTGIDLSALSANLLAPGVIFNGQTFALGQPNVNNSVQAFGQTLSLPAGTYASLSLLATSAWDRYANVPFTVTYADGSTQTFVQFFSEWLFPRNFPGEGVVATLPYRDNPDGSSSAQPVYLYGYTFALNPAKPLRSLTLPNQAKINILAIDLKPSSLHTAVPAPMDLSGLFSKVAFVRDGTRFGPGTAVGPNTGIDRSALSANLLGPAVLFNGQSFALGQPNVNNSVQAYGQTLSLPAGNYASLSFVATSAWDRYANVPFTVNYADGSTQTFVQSFSEWVFPRNFPGESVAATLPYRDNPDGSSPAQPVYLYGYTFALNPAKPLRSLSLPNQAKINILAMNLS